MKKLKEIIYESNEIIELQEAIEDYESTIEELQEAYENGEDDVVEGLIGRLIGKIRYNRANKKAERLQQKLSNVRSKANDLDSKYNFSKRDNYSGNSFNKRNKF